MALLAALCGGAAAPDPLLTLAARARVAVVADDATALSLHATAVLNWVGLAFPTWAPRPAGALQGRHGAFPALDAAAWKDAGVPRAARVAVLWMGGAPSPLVVAEGLDRRGCAAWALAVHGGPPPGADAWRAHGLCVVVVGDCAATPCPGARLARPGAPSAGARALSALPTGALRAWLSGAELRRFAGRRAAARVEPINGVAARVDASRRPWAVDAVVLHSEDAVRWAALRPLPAVGWQEPSPAFEVWISPEPRRAAAELESRLAGGWGAAWKATAQARLFDDAEAWTLEWRGLSPGISASAGWGALFRFPTDVHVAFGDDAARGRWQSRLADAWRHQGWTEDGGTWSAREGLAAVTATDGRAGWQVSTRAGRVDAPVRTANPWKDARLRTRCDGRRALAALRRAGMLSVADQPDMAWAAVVNEVLGAMLERLVMADAGLRPAEGGTRVQATLDVDMVR